MKFTVTLRPLEWHGYQYGVGDFKESGSKGAGIRYVLQYLQAYSQVTGNQGQTTII
jgi:hypothetical protein